MQWWISNDRQLASGNGIRCQNMFSPLFLTRHTKPGHKLSYRLRLVNDNKQPGPFPTVNQTGRDWNVRVSGWFRYVLIRLPVELVWCQQLKLLSQRNLEWRAVYWLLQKWSPSYETINRLSLLHRVTYLPRDGLCYKIVFHGTAYITRLFITTRLILRDGFTIYHEIGL